MFGTFLQGVANQINDKNESFNEGAYDVDEFSVERIVCDNNNSKHDHNHTEFGNQFFNVFFTMKPLTFKSRIDVCVKLER